MKPIRSNEQLCVLAQSGDAQVQEELLQNNLGFIRQKAHELTVKYSGLSIEQEDLIQEGGIGLLRAISGFDPERSVKFLSFAGPAVENAMTDYIRSVCGQFEQEAMADGKEIVSLNDTLDEEDFTEPIHLTEDPFAKNPERELIKTETIQELHHAILQLSARENAYIKYRFGFDAEDEERPLAETARHFHLKEGRARKLEEQALDNVMLELPWWYD